MKKTKNKAWEHISKCIYPYWDIEIDLEDTKITHITLTEKYDDHIFESQYRFHLTSKESVNSFISMLGTLLKVLKKHPDYEIECSNFGRVKLPTGTITKGYFSDGYKNIKLGKKSMKVHRLVCDTFKPYPFKITNSQHTQINHIDYDRGNNRIENLEWCTPKENIQHSRKRKHT
jgi:hypothetical protein